MREKGRETALVTTEGFEDVIEIGRQNRRDLYELRATKLPPLVSKDFRFGISERIDFEGNILKDLKKEEIKEIKKNIKDLSIESVAICLLFSYVNGEHERVIYEELKELGIPIFVSSQILPEYREFERCSTIVANAFVAPKMDSYLEKLVM